MKSVLNVKGIERTLISFRLPHRRRIDTSGYPCSLPRDSFFYVSFLAEEGDDFFMQWMCGKNIAHGGAKGFWHDGEIVFYDETSDGQEFYRYDLQYVMPIHFRLEYDHQNGMVIHLTLTALDRVYNRLFHTENFYGYFFEYAKPKEKPKPMPKEEPDILEIYYTDEKGNRVERSNFEVNTFIYLNVKGVDIVGKTGDLNIEDEDFDFEYEGNRLTNDILQDYTFKSNYDNIKLKILEAKKQ
ncbi:type VI secretion system tube protein TssD [Capnocytophaga canimorsus]|uniref:type VI secretion system tube protein TssD n=1 Tax=Capnocytophaga TaxID=1016 RepID=UPI0011C21CA9|nr:type VI secretion system tube protein TssD [Capnocytophaga canis]